MSRPIVLRDCSCGAKPGAFHLDGCCVAMCARCGRQCVACDCVYELNGIDVETLEQTHPSIYAKGATAQLYVALDAEIERLGGPLPWTGEFPGSADAREQGFWCRWKEGEGWVQCEPEHPEATEDLNRLVTACVWDARQRKWVQWRAMDEGQRHVRWVVRFGGIDE